MAGSRADYFRERENALLAEARAANILSSSTGLGRAREHFVSRFLSEHLPSRLVPARGELVDSTDRRSGEVDCVLVDHDSPAYRIGGEALVPIEAANSVFEIKSSLAGSELEGAIRKIARVKALVRTPHTGIYRFSEETKPLVPVPPITTHGYVVTYDGPAWETILSHLQANPIWYESDWMRFGPEIICVLGRGFVFKNDRHYWLPERENLRDSQAVRVDTPGVQAILEHIETTIARYGGLTYELARYNA